MLVVNNRIPVHPDHHAAFEEAFSQRAAMVDGMAGFISFQILRPTVDDAPYVVQTFWESRSHFEAWTSSDEFKQQHQRSSTLPEGAILGRPQLEVFEVIQSTAKIVRDE